MSASAATVSPLRRIETPSGLISVLKTGISLQKARERRIRPGITLRRRLRDGLVIEEPFVEWIVIQSGVIVGYGKRVAPVYGVRSRAAYRLPP